MGLGSAALILVGLLVGGASAVTPKLTSIRVAAVAGSVDSLPTVIGAAHGLFRADGLSITWVSAASDDAAVSLVTQGKADVALATGTQVLRLAASKGLPIRIVAGNSNYTKGLQSVLVSSASGINGPVDLAGKTLAIPSLGGFDEITAVGWLADNSVDPSTVRIVVLPYAAMAPALFAGLIDAGVTESPFTAYRGLKSIGTPASDLGASPTKSVYFSSTSYTKSHKATLQKFILGLKASFDYASSHSASVRAAARLNAGRTGSTASLVLPSFDTRVGMSSLSDQADLVAALGFTDQSADVEGLVWSDAPKAKP